MHIFKEVLSCTNALHFSISRAEQEGGRGRDSRETKVFTIHTLLKENTGNGFDHFEFYQRKEPTSQSADFPRSISVEHNYASKLHVFMWLVQY